MTCGLRHSFASDALMSDVRQHSYLLADLLRRGTAREPADRLASMAHLARSLEILRAGLVRTGQRRQRAWIAGIAAACTAAIAGLLPFALLWSTPPAPASPVACAVPIVALPGVCDATAQHPGCHGETLEVLGAQLGEINVH